MALVFNPLRLLSAVLLMAALLFMLPTPALAVDPATSNVCTNFATSAATMDTSTDPGILTNITTFIKDVINGATEKLYKAFTNSTGYKAAVYGAATLAVIFYGIGFMTGIVQASFGETLKRMVKFGIIFSLISPDGWLVFSDYAVQFFNDGTDALIGGVMQIGTGIPFDPTSDSPFQALDNLARFVLQPDTLVAIMGSTFAGGPFGLSMGALLSVAVFGLLKMIIEGLKIYAVSFVVRSLLLGVAPIFIVFLLFERTKPLFTSWLNSLLNLSLQPILYFTFLSFFIVMITSASKDMLKTELCWTEFKSTAGTQNKVSFWRLVETNKTGTASPITDEMTWQGSLTCRLGAEPEKCKAFPINIVDMLSFLILVYIASKFSTVVESISGEISNVFVNLDKNNKMEFQMNQKASEGGDVNPNASAALAKKSSALQTPPR